MQVITLKEHPEYLAEAIRYFQNQWASPDSLMVYEDSLTHSFSANPLPQCCWSMKKLQQTDVIKSSAVAA